MYAGFTYVFLWIIFYTKLSVNDWVEFDGSPIMAIYLI